ncbi:MAG TPA: 2-hydroxychromene-2-carboxylate isomerase [Acidisphaera sp.]|nr:2-hydroxychromene-2-carboxylate isomerase [Acidisphaera sp.]
MTDVTFYYDFGSPNAYMAHRVIPGVEARTGARFVYVPILLGGLFKLTNNQAPLAAYAGVKGKVENMRREMDRFVRRHQLTKFRWNPHFPVITVQCMRGAVAAHEEGIGPAYDEAVFAAIWEDGQKCDDPAVLRDVLSRAGLPADHLLARTAEQPIKDKLIANTQAACDAGAFGSPTFVVDGELYFGKEKLREIEDALTEAR